MHPKYDQHQPHYKTIKEKLSYLPRTNSGLLSQRHSFHETLLQARSFLLSFRLQLPRVNSDVVVLVVASTLSPLFSGQDPYPWSHLLPSLATAVTAL
ncbi:uncharacterized protein DS421_15g498500 [Arachis hypogaea]|nr:uncharacterized protein DS421_15g498500 [Arachis hypogaea]